jgi:hypothetical protein
MARLNFRDTYPFESYDAENAGGLLGMLQAIMHQGQAGMVAGLDPRSSGDETPNLSQAADYGPTPPTRITVRPVDPYSALTETQGSDGDLIGRLLALQAEQGGYQPASLEEQSGPQNPNFRQLSRMPAGRPQGVRSLFNQTDDQQDLRNSAFAGANSSDLPEMPMPVAEFFSGYKGHSTPPWTTVAPPMMTAGSRRLVVTPLSGLPPPSPLLALREQWPQHPLAAAFRETPFAPVQRLSSPSFPGYGQSSSGSPPAQPNPIAQALASRQFNNAGNQYPSATGQPILSDASPDPVRPGSQYAQIQGMLCPAGGTAGCVAAGGITLGQMLLPGLAALVGGATILNQKKLPGRGKKPESAPIDEEEQAEIERFEKSMERNRKKWAAEARARDEAGRKATAGRSYEPGDYCANRYLDEETNCFKRLPDYADKGALDACKAVARWRRKLCVKNGGRPDPSEPPEWGLDKEEVYRRPD